MAPRKITNARPVIVCTERRLVVFGYTDTDEVAPRAIRLTNARVAMRWGTTGGFGQLASTGPGKDAKIGARMPGLELTLVTAVIDVTDAAAKAFEAAPGAA